MGADALVAVRARIEGGWSQGADARDASGDVVSLADETAQAWSVPAAFALVATDGIPMDHVPRALRALGAVLETHSLIEWNDDPHRTQQEVLDALDAALTRIEGDSA